MMMRGQKYMAFSGPAHFRKKNERSFSLLPIHSPFSTTNLLRSFGNKTPPLKNDYAQPFIFFFSENGSRRQKEQNGKEEMAASAECHWYLYPQNEEEDAGVIKATKVPRCVISHGDRGSHSSLYFYLFSIPPPPWKYKSGPVQESPIFHRAPLRGKL